MYVLVPGVLIHEICTFKDLMKTAVRELAERTKTTYTYSERPYTRYVLIRSWRRKAPTVSNAELDD